MGAYLMRGIVFLISFVEPNKLNKPDEPDPRHALRNGLGHLIISTGPSRGARSSNDPRGVPEARDSTSRFGAGPLLRELCTGPGEYPDGWFDPS